MSKLALVTGHGLDDVLAWRVSGSVTVRKFLEHVHALAQELPAGQGVFNLCEDRYHFAVLFAACVLTQKISLQPSSQSAQTLELLAKDYPGAFAVFDDVFDAANGLPCIRFPDLNSLPASRIEEIAMINTDQVVAILFTSGSTGLPQPHTKTWGRLVKNGQAEAIGLGLTESPHALVGTVPAQHSYGFESTFLLALHGGCSFWSGKPFYPQDVVDALQSVPRPRMLVTTPHHLSTLMSSELTWAELDICLSATAPLDAELAARIEQRTRAPVLEIYGSTESGQLAHRRTVDGASWQLLPEVLLEQEDDTTYALGGHVEGRVPLSDFIELQGLRRFVMHGRRVDLINIAGKRSSLAYLSYQMCDIEGVVDGAFFLPKSPTESPLGLIRLTAFVVAPDLSPQALKNALRQRIDPVFLPRPLVFVQKLIRNSTGKLTQASLEALYHDWITHGDV